MGKILDQAIVFATKVHKGQFRKGTQVPYILHPVEAAAIVGTMTTDEEVIAGAVLYDVVEDTDTTVEDVIQMFGQRIGSFVAAESENKREELPAESTWKIRKQETLDFIDGDGFVHGGTGTDGLAGVVADSAANCREGVILLDQFQSFSVLALSCQTQVTLDCNMGGAGCLTGGRTGGGYLLAVCAVIYIPVVLGPALVRDLLVFRFRRQCFLGAQLLAQLQCFLIFFHGFHTAHNRSSFEGFTDDTIIPPKGPVFN